MPRKLYFDQPPAQPSPYQVTYDDEEPTRVQPVPDALRAEDEAPYDESAADDEYIENDPEAELDEYDDEEYSPESEALDNEQRFHTAMNVFDAVSIAVGVVAILALVGLLIALVSWVRTDVSSFITLFQSRI